MSRARHWNKSNQPRGGPPRRAYTEAGWQARINADLRVAGRASAFLAGKPGWPPGMDESDGLDDLPNLLPPGPTGWVDRAACVTDPEAAAAHLAEADCSDARSYEGWQVRRAALAACRACPVRVECLLAALEEEGLVHEHYRYLIRGGRTPLERTAIAFVMAGLPLPMHVARSRAKGGEVEPEVSANREEPAC